MFTFSLQGRRDNVFSLAAAGLERDREAPSIIVWVMPVAFYPHVLLCLAVVAARTSQTKSIYSWLGRTLEDFSDEDVIVDNPSRSFFSLISRS